MTLYLLYSFVTQTQDSENMFSFMQIFFYLKLFSVQQCMDICKVVPALYFSIEIHFYAKLTAMCTVRCMSSF